MKYIIFADVHGNLQAFKRFSEDVAGYDGAEFICVGDIVGYGANPEECINGVRIIGAECVMGNHDAAVVNETDISVFNKYASWAILWTQRNISQDSCDYIKTFKFIYENDFFVAAHGALHGAEKFPYLREVKDAEKTFEQLKKKICFVGHTHVPEVFTCKEDSVSKLPCEDFIVEEGSRYIVNVGSVGQPRGNDPRACYCVYDIDTGKIEFHKVEYDAVSAREAILNAGLPATLGDRLIYGH